ncbi:hypothetical protein FQN60_015922 [Etheostoma spectabile]|uniref:Lysosome-associated membrane glycoprotein 5 n=2 Tax=Etheostoma spectabile TaxID=54343 RepID=A0A5J5CRX6_9PERO|nr:hypothetical protein FQN60_015922 [Etheostoma spectabile]
MLKAQGKSDGQTGTKILLEAMAKDKVHLARFVLDALDGEIVDSKTEDAQTPLISSVLLPDSQTRCKFVELLLQRGANVNCQDGNGRTALSYACEKGYLDNVKNLVRNNADPEIVDAWGNTALMYAAVAGHSPVVEFLVRAFKRLGLQIDRQNKVGNSAVEVATFLGHTECIAALSNNSKAREAERGARGNAQPRLGLGRGDVIEKFERRVGHLGNKLEDLQTCNHAECLLVRNCTCQPRLWVKQGRLPSMDSIEEFERENDSSSSPPQELVFSKVLTPKPPPRTSEHSANSKHLKPGDNYLPPLKQRSIFFSPRPSRNTPKPSAPSALGILLAPILSNKSEMEPENEKSKLLDFGVRRFHESYYQKRSSLPTSILRPTPPDRTLVPVRKSRTTRRREASPCKPEPLLLTTPTAATSTTAFSVLSNTLLRRFTSPEFKKDAEESEKNLMLTSGRIPRSETFPQGMKHPQRELSPAAVTGLKPVNLGEGARFGEPELLGAGCFCRANRISRPNWTLGKLIAMGRLGFSTTESARLLLFGVFGVLALSVVLAEQEGENLSGLSDNPDKAIFAVRENGTTCLMVEFAVRFLVPYDVLALNGIDLITEQAAFTLPRGAEIEGKCGSTESEIQITWKNKAYTLRIYFDTEFRDKGIEVWKISRIQFVYDTSETSHFTNAYNPGKHTANTHHLVALVTPFGRSYACSAQQTFTLISSDHQKGVTISMYDTQIQPFDIASDFIFSEPYKCITDQRERLEETLPLILGFILALIIVITLTIYHFHLKLTANQPQLPRDRSMYKNM